MKSSKAFDELSKKKSLRSIRHVIERMLGMDHNEFFGEKVPAPMDPSVTGGAAASAAIENWRIPRTLCSLSWRDGTLGRAFITCLGRLTIRSTRSASRYTLKPGLEPSKRECYALAKREDQQGVLIRSSDGVDVGPDGVLVPHCPCITYSDDQVLGWSGTKGTLLDAEYKSPLDERDILESNPDGEVDFLGRYLKAGS